MGFDLVKPVQVGLQEDKHVLFFKLTGTITNVQYLYVKFENHGTRNALDIVGHLVNYVKTRVHELDGCKSSRKEKISAKNYKYTHDPVILSGIVSQNDKKETVAYSESGQRLGCELYVGEEKRKRFSVS